MCFCALPILLLSLQIHGAISQNIPNVRRTCVCSLLQYCNRSERLSDRVHTTGKYVGVIQRALFILIWYSSLLYGRWRLSAFGQTAVKTFIRFPFYCNVADLTDVRDHLKFRTLNVNVTNRRHIKNKNSKRTSPEISFGRDIAYFPFFYLWLSLSLVLLFPLPVGLSVSLSPLSPLSPLPLPILLPLFRSLPFPSSHFPSLSPSTSPSPPLSLPLSFSMWQRFTISYSYTQIAEFPFIKFGLFDTSIQFCERKTKRLNQQKWIKFNWFICNRRGLCVRSKFHLLYFGDAMHNGCMETCEIGWERISMVFFPRQIHDNEDEFRYCTGCESRICVSVS